MFLLNSSRPRLVVSIVLVIAFLVSLFPLGPAPATGAEAATSDLPWKWLNPIPQGNTLLDVDIIDATHGFAVGENGTVLKWDGSNWTMMKSGTTETITAVSALRGSKAWATVADKVLAWNGTQWSGLPLPGISNLSDISAASGKSVWVVNGSNTVARWNGTAWKKWQVPDCDGLGTVFALNESNVWAGGIDGTIAYWNGSVWTKQTTDSASKVNSISGYDASNLWAGTDDGAILKWDGSQWVTNDRFDATSVTGVTAADAANVYACYLDGSVRSWDGSNWNEVDFEQYVPAVFTGISAGLGGSVFAVGESGMIAGSDGTSGWRIHSVYPLGDIVDSANSGALGVDLLLTDYGFLFGLPLGEVMAVPLLSGEDGNVTSVAASDVSFDFLVTTSSGKVYAASPSGYSVEVPVPTTGVPLFDAGYVGIGDMYVVGAGGTVLHWSNGAFEQQSTGTSADLLKLDALDTAHIWAVGEGGVWFSDGTGWTQQHDAEGDTLTGIKALDASHVYAVGASGKFYSWDGSAWDTQVITESGGLRNLDALAPDNIIVVAESGVIYTWDGSSWTQRRSPALKNLNTVTMNPLGYSIIGGEGGAILLYGKAPEVVLNNFNDGGVLGAGETRSIYWRAVRSAATFDVKLSVDGGATWKKLNQTPVTGNSFDAKMPVPPSGTYGNCLIKVQAFDDTGKLLGVAKSAKPFKIQSVVLTGPAPGAELQKGSTESITWDTYKTSAKVKAVKLTYTTNGTDWTGIPKITDPTIIANRNYKWTVPNVGDTPITSCLIKIKLLDVNGNVIASDVTDAPFTITP